MLMHMKKRNAIPRKGPNGEPGPLFNGKSVTRDGEGVRVGNDYHVAWHDAGTDPSAQMLLWDQAAMAMLLVVVIAEARSDLNETDKKTLERFREVVGM